MTPNDLLLKRLVGIWLNAAAELLKPSGTAQPWATGDISNSDDTEIISYTSPNGNYNFLAHIPREAADRSCTIV
ncbi:hypothetical protein EYF80_055162 [Liparis tanakae]|uniref:Uncharacterized protein n=1 Tax=Liparis tanakae TaxID=230148 RepID=A0A4Z2F0K7_9TELE|nr:hypothetical protein EYF80_055162 [Liparis tanakae]